ncbi:uncharacterized protein GJ701_000995 isoform 1-T1 [Geothlypis trichas]
MNVSQQCGLHEEECHKQVEGGDVFPLPSLGETPSALLCLFLGCPIQQRYWRFRSCGQFHRGAYYFRWKISRPARSWRRRGMLLTFLRPASLRGAGSERPPPAAPARGRGRGAGNRETGNGEPGTGNREPGTGNRKPRTGNREQGARNRELGAGSREPGTENREPGTGILSNHPRCCCSRLVMTAALDPGKNLCALPREFLISSRLRAGSEGAAGFVGFQYVIFSFKILPSYRAGKGECWRAFTHEVICS